MKEDSMKAMILNVREGPPRRRPLGAVLFSLTLLLASCASDRYGSRELPKTGMDAFPTKALVEGITRISDTRAYCIPTCLRMIADSAGVREPIEYVNWVTGFSYGGLRKGSFSSFMPVSDAMMGLSFGAPYLGLERELYWSDDREHIVRGIKSEIAKGSPVMLMYDYNAIAGEDFFFPHAAVVVGYSESEFIYLEPGFSDAYEPDSKAFSAAAIDAFLDGVLTLQRMFTGTAGYSFMVFRPRERLTDYAAVWERDGKELRGMSVPFIDLTMGAKACRALAGEIEATEIPAWGWEKLLPVWFEFGRYSRADNAAFVLGILGSDEGAEAARLLLSSSESYARIMLALADSANRAVLIPPLLRNIADDEEDLGKEFLSLAKTKRGIILRPESRADDLARGK